MVTFFLIFFALYSLINFYIFIRGWQALEILHNFRLLYSVIFVLFAFSYVFSRIFATKLPNFVYYFLSFVGSFWFFVLLYAFMFVLLIDILRLLNSFIPFFPVFISKNYLIVKFFLYLLINSIIIFVAIAGYKNRSQIKIKELSISLNSNLGKEYKIIFFSDLHISVVNNHKFLKSIVEEINKLEPDLILIGGDIVDEKPERLERDGLCKPLMGLKSRNGVLAITGNHEYINGRDLIVDYLKKFNINFISDSSVLIDNSFYIIGREDRAIETFMQKKRKPLSEIVANLNTDVPKILMDHQPINLNDAVANGIDLQLSGHTHHGQISPLNEITKLVYEVSWGYKQKGRTHIYVSSGIGTWGPPIKIGNDAELILIKLKL